MPVLLCPLCSSSVEAAALETHVRLELGYAPLRCLLCPASFTGHHDALGHFRGDFATHPGAEVRYAETRDAAVEARLRQVLDAARAPDSCRGACCRRCRDYGSAAVQTFPTPAQSPRLASPQPKPAVAGVSEADASEAPEPAAASQAPVPAPVKSLLPLVKQEEGEAHSPPPAKPRLASSADGKVACLLCAHRSEKKNFRLHALRAHVAAQPYLCNLCPYASKEKGNVQKHLRKDHPEAAPSDLTAVSLKAEIEAAVEECFGSVELEALRVLCRACQAPVLASARRHHAATQHLKKAFHACRLCDWTSTAPSPAEAAKHLKKRHGQRPSGENMASEAERYEPVLERLVQQIFPLA